MEPTARHDRTLELLSELRRATAGMRYVIVTPGTSANVSVHDIVALHFDAIEKAVNEHRGGVESDELVGDQLKAMKQSLYPGDDRIFKWHPEVDL